MNKNQKARLRKVGQSLHKALDSLHRAKGELYPQELAGFRQPVDASIKALETANAQVDAALAEQPKPDPAQADIEDAIEAAPQPSERSRRG